MTTVLPTQYRPRILTFEELDREYPPAARGVPAVQPPVIFDARPAAGSDDYSRAGSSKTHEGFGRTSSQSSTTCATTDDGIDNSNTGKGVNVEVVLGVAYFYLVTQQDYKANPELELVQSDYSDAKLQFDNLIKIFHSNTLPYSQQLGVSSLLDALAYFQVEHD